MIAAVQSEVAVIKLLLLKHANDAFVSDSTVRRQWHDLGYTACPDFTRAVEEYDRFVRLLERFGIEIVFLPADDRVGLDSIYVRDASIVCSGGAILCNMGKAGRRSEPQVQDCALRKAGLPILGRITGDGTVEGGDVVWLDDRTVAVGRGYRTNDAGIEQLRDILDDCIDEFIVVPLPHWRGQDDVFHLMSILSPIDHDLALVYSPLLPVPFREQLLARGIELVEVADQEFETMGCNVLAVAPRKCIMLSGNAATLARLERVGAEVHQFEGVEICVKGSGGPTCLTRPIVRGW
jgi:N-dimethylarginine dimethylaminohydrolase